MPVQKVTQCFIVEFPEDRKQWFIQISLHSIHNKSIKTAVVPNGELITFFWVAQTIFHSNKAAPQQSARTENGARVVLHHLITIAPKVGRWTYLFRYQCFRFSSPDSRPVSSGEPARFETVNTMAFFNCGHTFYSVSRYLVSTRNFYLFT